MKPIIDIHTHIFNAMDIPLEGYLLSRRRESKKFLDLTYLADFSIIPHLCAYLSPRIRERCITRILKKKRELEDPTKGWIYSLLVWLIGVCMGAEFSAWEESLSKGVENIASELVKTWEDIDLYVPLMIDYEYWFKHSSDNDIKDQIDLIYKNVILPHKGKIHPFAPYCPTRELAFKHKRHNPDGELETEGSLALVKDAIENKGFIGVKLYNSLGYKPFNNNTVDDEQRRVRIRNENMQYLFDGDKYDEVLSELYDYCVENEIPITTHCTMYGIESYPDASFDFGKAIFWRNVLDQKKYKNLHLNLAHFGWYPPEGFHGKIGWVKDICEMLDDYHYLFTDVACHPVVLKKYFNKFKSDYKEMCSTFSIVKERLLFGTDWHILKRLKNFKEFKNKYIEILTDEDLFSSEEIENFLGGNALKFLGLYKGSKNFERLKRFYKKANINPPKWFNSIN
jgi:predicted TIM-barrel fold metal-dependent hydrolase